MPQRRARYSRIFSGERGQAGNAAIQKIANYWISGAKADKTNRIGKGDPRPVSKKVLIRPFKFGADTTEANNPYDIDIFVVASGNLATFEKYKDLVLEGSTKIGDAFHYTKPNNAELSTEDITPGRIIVITGRSAKAESKTSKITGLEYGSYGGKSTSFPIGVLATGTAYDTIVELGGVIQTETAVAEAIASKIRNAAQGTPPLVNYKKEYARTVTF